MQLTYRNANGDIEVVRAGKPLPANPAPIVLASNIVEVTGLNAGGRISPFVAHDPPNNYSLTCGIYVPRGVRVRFLLIHLDMNFSTTNAGEHMIGAYAMRINNTSNPVSPVYTLVHAARSLPLQGTSITNTQFAGAPSGLGVGQQLLSSYFNQFPVELPETLYQYDPDIEQLLIFVVFNNRHATENITGPIRLYFHALCF